MLKWPSCVVIATLLGCFALSADPLTYNLSLDTSGFSAITLPQGQHPFLEFRINGAAGNTVTVSNPSFNGGSLISGGQTLTLQSSPTNLGSIASWEFSPGTSASFTLSTTDIGPTETDIFGPDLVFVLLDDPTQTAYGTSDPTGNNSLFTLTLTGSSSTDVPALYSGIEPPINGVSLTQGSTGSTGSTGTTGSTGAVAEPASSKLLGFSGVVLILLALFGRKRVRTQN